MALYGKWSGCRSCYVALLLGGNCGLLSHSGCTQKTQQNEQCLPPQCCTRREEIHPKKALRPWSQWFTRGKHGTGGNQLCLGDTCKTKKLCALQRSWMRQQPAPVPSKCPSAEANTQERSPAALCHCKTPFLDGVRCWKVLTHSSNTTSDGNRSWKIPQQLHLEEEQQIPASDGIAYTSSLLTTVQLKRHSAVFIFCIATLQTTDFHLLPIPKRRTFQQLPNSTVERCPTDTLIDWGELWDLQAKYLIKV